MKASVTLSQRLQGQGRPNWQSKTHVEGLKLFKPVLAICRQDGAIRGYGTCKRRSELLKGLQGLH